MMDERYLKLITEKSLVRYKKIHLIFFIASMVVILVGCLMTYLMGDRVRLYENPSYGQLSVKSDGVNEVYLNGEEFEYIKGPSIGHFAYTIPITMLAFFSFIFMIYKERMIKKTAIKIFLEIYEKTGILPDWEWRYDLNNKQG